MTFVKKKWLCICNEIIYLRKNVNIYEMFAMIKKKL